MPRIRKRLVSIFLFTLSLATVLALQPASIAAPAPDHAPPASPLIVSPGARCCMGMTYDGSHNQIVLFGGCCDSMGNYWGDTWTWDGTNWHNVTPATSPCPRVSTRMVWDGHQVVLFGGTGALPSCATGGLQSDTWLWDGTSWTPCNLAHSDCTNPNQPTARESEGVAYDQSNPPDATSGKVIMFGGNSHVADGQPSTPDELLAAAAPTNDTWQWDGSVKDWTKLAPSGTLPCNRNSAGLAFDFSASRNRILLFGGQGDSSCSGGVAGPLNDTWTWSGTKWVKCSDAVCNPNGLSVRTGHRVAWDNDAAIQRIVLFGGSSPGCSNTGNLCNDTWYIDGGAWTQQSTTSQPTPRCCVGLAYDALHSRLILFGGAAANRVNQSDTWEWSGTPGSWCQAGVSC